MDLNKTIYKFSYKGEKYEVDWLTDATCQNDEMVCDIFKEDKCVGQVVVLKYDDKKTIKKICIEEMLFQHNQQIN